jgi:glutathione S-transferase
MHLHAMRARLRARSSDRGAWQFKYIHVDLGEDKPAWFKEEVNPFGTVPCIYDHGRGVFESAIIVEFLEVRCAARAAPAARQRSRRTLRCAGQVSRARPGAHARRRFAHALPTHRALLM